MTKEEVFLVVHEAVVEARVNELSAARISEKVIEALWSKFILFHQGEEVELPEGPPADPTPERSCVECGAREGFGQIAFTGGAIICAGCLRIVERRGTEARQWWEKAFIAYLHAPKLLLRDNGIPFKADDLADLALAHWLHRFGSRP